VLPYIVPPGRTPAYIDHTRDGKTRMANALFYAHSGLRFLVLVAALIAAAMMLWKRSSGQPFDSQGKAAITVFIAVLDLQFLLGFANLFTRPFYSGLIGHVVMMFAAVAAAHAVTVYGRKQADARRAHTICFAGIVLALVLIIGGIMAIRPSPFHMTPGAGATATSTG
jgi:hypothetical protein